MARLVCIQGLEEGKNFEFTESEVTLGSSKANQIVLAHDSLSPRHAKIKKVGRSFIIEDLDSLGGTFVNDEKIKSSELKDGDVLALGEVSFKFQTKGTIDDTTPLWTPQPGVKLICQEGMEKGFEFDIEDETTPIGRDEENKIKLFHKSISRKHCIISQEAGKVFIKDLGSMNGTRVNGTNITEQEIFNNDEVEIGELKFLLTIEQPPPAPNDATIMSQSAPFKTMLMTKDDLESVDGSEMENVLMMSSIRSVEPEVVDSEEVQEPEIAEKPFLDKVISIEWERQRLYLLHEVSKGLYAMESSKELQKYLPAVIEPLFRFKNFMLLSGEESAKPMVHKGPLAHAKARDFLSRVAPDQGNTVFLDLRSDEFKQVRAAGAGATALIGAIGSSKKSPGIFYLDFRDVIDSRERVIFEMLIEVMSIVITKLS